MKSNIKHSWFRGKMGEEIAKQDYKEHGFRIIPTRKGSDFIAIKQIGYITQKEIVEVKTGKSPLTKIQKKKKNEAQKQGITYTVYRISALFLDHYLKNKELKLEIILIIFICHEEIVSWMI